MIVTEPVSDLTLDHARPEGRPRSTPILFVHGLWAASWTFQEWLPLAASRGWDAWAINMRGRNGSRPVDDLGGVGIEDFTRDVLDAMDHLGQVVVAGYSMGGLVAQTIAHDRRVKALVLLCSIPPRGIVAMSGAVLRRSWRYVPSMLAGRPFRPNRRDAEVMIMNRLPPEYVDRWYPMLLADSARAAWQIALGAVGVDPTRVGCPVLVVSAEFDRISPPAIQPKLVRRYGADHLGVAGRGHAIAYEPGWEATAGAILDWAERTVSK